MQKPWRRSPAGQPWSQKNPGAHFNLAQLYEVLENHDRAREHYQRVLELDPRHQEAAERLRDLIG